MSLFELASFEFTPANVAPSPFFTSDNAAQRRCFITAEINGQCDQLLCNASGQLQLFSVADVQQLITAEISSQHYLGLLDLGLLESHELCDQELRVHELWVIVLRGFATVDKHQWQGLRSQAGLISEAWFLLAGRALQIAQWFYDHRFCGRCGKPTETDSIDRAHVCKACNLRFYPRISPCMIVLVTHGDELLLAHHARATRPVYTTLAGFVEAGERVEDAVHREVMEEVGVSLSKLTYFTSQPWPFPGQLMLGFFAEYQAGDITIDGVEIVDAKWFRYDNLPTIPSTNSVAGQLINDYVQRRYALKNP